MSKPPTHYVRGYFTQPIYRGGAVWPPGYKPRPDDKRCALNDRENSSRAREKQKATGTGWRSGTIPGLGKGRE